MSTEALRHLQTRRAQRGAILVVVLLFMTILTILGISALSTGVLEEKMARNSRDYNIALQAAEAVLQDARYDLQGRQTMELGPESKLVSDPLGEQRRAWGEQLPSKDSAWQLLQKNH